MNALYLPLVTLFAALVTAVVRGYALRTGLQDLPNHRSSHRESTPRGGGLAIVVASALAYAALAIFLPDEAAPEFLWVFGLGTFLAIIGWYDDKQDLPAVLRLVAHVLVAAALVMVLIRTPEVSLTALAATGVLLLCVWATNTFNFMDGINGLAALQAAFFFSALPLLLLSEGQSSLAWPGLFVAAACLGFLPANFPKARIFLGDVGSTFLGFFACAYGAIAVLEAGVHIAVPLILYGSFACDASLTLFTRGLRKQKVWQAHRSHAYQRLVQKGYSHTQVTLAYLALNLLWLAPLAYWAHTHPGRESWVLLLAYLPLLAIFAKLGAGRGDNA